MLNLIWNNIVRRRGQSLLTVAITFMTVMIFVMVLGIFQIVNQGLALSSERLGADAILVPKYAAATGSDLLFTAVPENIYMPNEVLDQAKQLEGVAAVTPQFYAQTFDMSCCDTGGEVRIVGYDAETDFILTPYLEPGSAHNTAENEVILGSTFHEGFVGKKYLILAQSFDVINQLLTTGTGMDDMFFMDMDSARQLCLTSSMISTDWVGKDPYEVISVVMVKLQEGVDPQAFAEQVDESGMEARCILTSDTIASLQKQLKVTMQVMFALWLGSLMIAVMALVGRFNALAKERKKEIGLLRSIGLKKGQVFGLIIGETCTMALIGGILGSGIALLCMEPVINVLKEAFALSPSVWNTSLALLCAGAGVLLAGFLGFAAAVSPAWKSASMDPQAAITQGEVN